MKKEQLEHKLNAYYIQYAEENDIPFEEVKEALEKEWGKGGSRGYGIFSNGVGFDGVECICRIDEMDIYDGDIDAAKQAEKDGFKLIPWKEQPKFYPFCYYRFIDTPQNREALWREAKRLKESGY